jgi:hypothetical protein
MPGKVLLDKDTRRRRGLGRRASRDQPQTAFSMSISEEMSGNAVSLNFLQLFSPFSEDLVREPKRRGVSFEAPFTPFT